MGRRRWAGRSRATSDRPKASVLPDPVGARPATSRPARASGMTADWIGNGSVIAAASRRAQIRGHAELGEPRRGGGHMGDFQLLNSALGRNNGASARRQRRCRRVAPYRPEQPFQPPVGRHVVVPAIIEVQAAVDARPVGLVGVGTRSGIGPALRGRPLWSASRCCRATADLIVDPANTVLRVLLRLSPAHRGRREPVAPLLGRSIDEGVLSLDDTVGERLPDLPDAWSAVTLRQLLNHTSGVPDFIHASSFADAVGASLGRHHRQKRCWHSSRTSR